MVHPVSAVAGALDVEWLMAAALGHLFRDLLEDALALLRGGHRRARATAFASRRRAGRAIERLGMHERHEILEVQEALLVAAERLCHRHQLQALRWELCH